MSKMLAHTRQTQTAAGEPITLEYYLQNDAEGYGIEIILRRADRAESNAIAHIEREKAPVLALLECLARNTVTPCALPEVMDELLAHT